MAADRKQDPEGGEESQKRSGEILASEISQGLQELKREAGGLFFSGLSAGLDIGFSLFLMGVMLTAVQGQLPDGVIRILVANMYSVGFIFVVLGRSELFTEHTALAVFPVLSGEAGVGALSRLWVLVYFANLVGAAASAALSVVIGPALNVIDPRVFGEIAVGLVDHPVWVILLSGIMAGWLMGLLSWLLSASRETISQILIVWLITTAIGFGQLHHSIAGTVEVLAGVFANQGVGFGEFGHFLLWATVGNALGGVIFVAVIKYSHAVRQHDIV